MTRLMKNINNNKVLENESINCSISDYKRWTKEEIDFLVKNCKEHGMRECANELNRTERSVAEKIRKLGLLKESPETWEDNQIKFLFDNYEKYGILYCSKNLNKSVNSTVKQARLLGIQESSKKWTDEEINWLKNNYQHGSVFCSEYLGRTTDAIIERCKKLELGRYKLKYSILTKEFLEKELIENGKSLRQLSKEININWSFIKRYAQTYGLLLEYKQSQMPVGRKYETNGYGEISGMYWFYLQKGAMQRNLEFTITIEEAWDLFIKQNKQCALCGRELILDKRMKHHYTKNQTASLDRKNSDLGYTLDNCQWIYKHFNRMKSDTPNEIFIEHCIEIADYQRKIRKNKVDKHN